MCILFYQLNAKPEDGPYRLVLANNRDEYWARPTATAAHWGMDGNCLSSLDREPGREGGTWLGMTKTGKIGVLLNILGENLPNRKGRGFLVSDYLTSDTDSASHGETVAADVAQSEYNGFHLILLQINENSSSSYVVSEKAGDTHSNDKKLSSLPLTEVHGFGNSSTSTPWQKVVYGKQKFREIIQANTGSQGDRQTMVDSLMTMLNDRTQHMPDPVLEGTCRELQYPSHIVNERSALCVCSPSILYGTRTNTVILVDWEGKCEYIERSLVTPVTTPAAEVNTTTFTFNLDFMKS